MGTETENEFEVGPTVITRFNAWLNAMDNGPLEEVMRREAGLITGWRISRYAKGCAPHTQSYSDVMRDGATKDMSSDEVKAFKALHGMQLKADAAALAGAPAPVLTEVQLAEKTAHEAIKKKYEERSKTTPVQRFNTSKVYEPSLEYRQLRNAMADFRRDYVPEWNLDASEFVGWGTLLNTFLGGLVYMTNEQDEAQHYADMRRDGEIRYGQLFGHDGKALNDSVLPIIRLFDEHVHDSRAWFMNAELNERELFSDYFRYRNIFFDTESNNELTLLVTTERVVGVALSVASVGLSVKRHDPRFLVGLMIPTLGTPVFRGKVGFPSISAFDTVTRRALPMVEGLTSIRAFSKDTASAVKAAQALPLAPLLSEATATTEDLIAILKGEPAEIPVPSTDELARTAARKSRWPSPVEIDPIEQAIAELVGGHVYGKPYFLDIDSIV